MDLVSLFIDHDSERFHEILEEDSWQTPYYHFSTESIFWNTASLITLSKEDTLHAAEALLYLLKKEAVALSFWQQWKDKTPSPGMFIRSVITGGRFTNTRGKFIPKETFWKAFTATMDGMKSEPGLEFTVDGKPTDQRELLNEEAIQTVICFDNTWQEQNYFIETVNDWILYRWGTAA